MQDISALGVVRVELPSDLSQNLSSQLTTSLVYMMASYGEQLCILASCFFQSDKPEFRLREVYELKRFTVIQEKRIELQMRTEESGECGTCHRR